MSFREEKRYQDIAFIEVGKQAAAKKSRPLLIAALAMLIALLLLAIGYVAGLKAGAIEPPCCIGALDFDFDFGS